MNVRDLKIGELWKIKKIGNSRSIINIWPDNAVNFPGNSPSTGNLADSAGTVRDNSVVLILATNYNHTTDRDFVKVLVGETVGWAALGIDCVIAKRLMRK